MKWVPPFFAHFMAAFVAFVVVVVVDLLGELQ